MAQDDLAPDFDLTASPGAGVIVGSVVAVPDDRYEPPYFESGAYFYENVDAPEQRGVLRSGVGSVLGRWDEKTCAQGIPSDRKALRDGHSIPVAACGRLFAVALPAGRYRVHTVQVRWPIAASVQRTDRYSFFPEAFEWTVGAGQVTYLGEFRSRVCYPSRAVSGGVRDEFERDWLLLTATFHVLAAYDVVSDIVRAPEWVWIPPDLSPATWPDSCWPLAAD